MIYPETKSLHPATTTNPRRRQQQQQKHHHQLPLLHPPPRSHDHHRRRHHPSPHPEVLPTATLCPRNHATSIRTILQPLPRPSFAEDPSIWSLVEATNLSTSLGIYTKWGECRRWIEGWVKHCESSCAVLFCTLGLCLVLLETCSGVRISRLTKHLVKYGGHLDVRSLSQWIFTH